MLRSQVERHIGRLPDWTWAKVCAVCTKRLKEHMRYGLMLRHADVVSLMVGMAAFYSAAA